MLHVCVDAPSIERSRFSCTPRKRTYVPNHTQTVQQRPEAGDARHGQLHPAGGAFLYRSMLGQARNELGPDEPLRHSYCSAPATSNVMPFIIDPLTRSPSRISFQHRTPAAHHTPTHIQRMRQSWPRPSGGAPTRRTSCWAGSTRRTAPRSTTSTISPPCRLVSSLSVRGGCVVVVMSMRWWGWWFGGAGGVSMLVSRVQHQGGLRTEPQRTHADIRTFPPPPPKKKQQKLNFGAHGYGSNFTLSVFDREWKVGCLPTY